MDRRKFLNHTAAASILSLPIKANQSSPLSDYRLALAQAEKRVLVVLPMQMMDRKHRQAGGFIIPAYGFAYAGSTAAEITYLGTLYCNPDSQYFHSEDIRASASRWGLRIWRVNKILMARLISRRRIFIRRLTRLLPLKI